MNENPGPGNQIRTGEEMMMQAHSNSKKHADNNDINPGGKIPEHIDEVLSAPHIEDPKREFYVRFNLKKPILQTILTGEATPTLACVKASTAAGAQQIAEFHHKILGSGFKVETRQGEKVHMEGGDGVIFSPK